MFMVSDFLSLRKSQAPHPSSSSLGHLLTSQAVLQAIGGAIADTANTHKSARVGIDIMIAGLFLQALSLFAFLIFLIDFGWSCRKGSFNTDPEKQKIRRSMLFKLFRAGILLATIAILIRSIFRVAELWEGFTGDLWNNQTDFMVLDGCMIAIAAVCLTAFHPGLAFGGQWRAADWSFKTSKRSGTGEKS